MQTFPSRPPVNPLADIASSPRWFPHAIDALSGQVLLVERSEADFRAASFLDDRALTQATPRQIVPWTALEQAMPAGARDDADYIFHIGHVGSTLLSRVLGEHPHVLALREPVLLRAFTDLAALSGAPESPWAPEWLEPRLRTLRILLSRTFRPKQRAMVKATSFTSELAPRLVPPQARALLMFDAPARYLENILAGDASRQELQMMTGQRIKRLAGRLGEAPARLWELNEGQKAALGWACEMSALLAAADALGDRARWCDFQAFLAAPAARLQDVATFFRHDLAGDAAETVVRGPLMRRYSKGPEHDYSPQLRDQVLAQSRQQNRAAIASGLGWLDEAAKRHSLIARCLQIAA